MPIILARVYDVNNTPRWLAGEAVAHQSSTTNYIHRNVCESGAGDRIYLRENVVKKSPSFLPRAILPVDDRLAERRLLIGTAAIMEINHALTERAIGHYACIGRAVVNLQ